MIAIGIALLFNLGSAFDWYRPLSLTGWPGNTTAWNVLAFDLITKRRSTAELETYDVYFWEGNRVEELFKLIYLSGGEDADKILGTVWDMVKRSRGDDAHPLASDLSSFGLTEPELWNRAAHLLWIIGNYQLANEVADLSNELNNIESDQTPWTTELEEMKKIVNLFDNDNR